MKKIVKLISITIFSMLFISIAEARMLTYVIIGDSIMSGVANSTMNGPDGQAKELAANIVMNSRNVSIRNLSSTKQRRSLTNRDRISRVFKHKVIQK